MILDERDRVLLVRFTFPAESGPDREVWATPGGGLEPGESLTDGLARELHEEVGDIDLAGARPIWTRTHVFEMSGGYDGQHETYFLVRVDGHVLAPALTPEQLAAEYVTAAAWWTAAELAAATTTATARFAPRRLPELVRDLVDGGPPAEPYDVGV